MDIYASLLEEFGIFDHGISPDIVPDPIMISEGVNDELYEFWDNYGPSDEEHPMVMDYQQEQEYSLNIKKIHRYDRKERFRYTLYQLIGASGNVPNSLCNDIKKFLGKKIRKSKVWNQVRDYLKKNGQRQYYNRIPQIIGRVYKLKIKGLDSDVITKIFNDFHRFHYMFDNDLRYKWKRSYFPNLRFVALKLLDKYGAMFPYTVPLVRTIRKRKYLLTLYNDFNI